MPIVLAVRGKGIRRTDAAGCDDHIVLLAHPPRGFYDLLLIIGYDLHSLQINPQREAEFGKVCRVRVDRLLAPSQSIDCSH